MTYQAILAQGKEHRRRIIRETLREEENNTPLNQLIDDSTPALQAIALVASFLALIFIIVPALFEIWVR